MKAIRYTLNAVIVFGALCGIWLILSARGDDTWPTTHARIMESHRLFQIGSTTMFPHTSVGPPLSRWRVHYVYQVSEISYEGRGTTHFNPKFARDLKVYYHANHPSTSVIHPGIDWLPVSVCFSLALVAFAARWLFSTRWRAA